jgi:hypothetical protein
MGVEVAELTAVACELQMLRPGKRMSDGVPASWSTDQKYSTLVLQNCVSCLFAVASTAVSAEFGERIWDEAEQAFERGDDCSTTGELGTIRYRRHSPLFSCGNVE